jgi:hypothetical protein
MMIDAPKQCSSDTMQPVMNEHERYLAGKEHAMNGGVAEFLL